MVEVFFSSIQPFELHFQLLCTSVVNGFPEAKKRGGKKLKLSLYLFRLSPKWNCISPLDKKKEMLEFISVLLSLFLSLTLFPNEQDFLSFLVLLRCPKLHPLPLIEETGWERERRQNPLIVDLISREENVA